MSDETFFAWLDGELGADEAARVGAEVAADPQLSAMAAEHRAMQMRLKGAFDPLLDRPLPDAMTAAVSSGSQSDVVDFAKAKARRDQARRLPSAAHWPAIAATLLVGILIGAIVPHGRSAAPVEVEAGRMYAAASLNRALDTQLASAPAGDVRIGITFRDKAGTICRSFTTAASNGLACRENGRWQMRGLFAAPEGQGGNYRMAAGMDPNLAALVDSTMAGEPLDAASEKGARANGWR